MRSFQVWKDYFPAVDAIVFLIDACDRDRFSESKVELDSLLTDEQLSNCPVLILGNKIDRPGAASEDEVRKLSLIFIAPQVMSARKARKIRVCTYSGNA